MGLCDPNNPHPAHSVEWTRRNERYREKIRRSGLPPAPRDQHRIEQPHGLPREREGPRKERSEAPRGEE